MNHYEIMVLTNPQLEEQAQKEVIEFVKNFITDNGGEVIMVDHWGKRSTTYAIKRHQEAYYDVIYYRLLSEHLPELERRLKLKESVLRYMNLKMLKVQIPHLKNKAALIKAKEQPPAEVVPEPESISEPVAEKSAITLPEEGTNE
ncbi:MAG: 30S ribosomal protein S6 [Candidatus Fischerbacteria bacterium RBG_13_37_8]|uniref:Small ribosomal subunit protein bS6 n=1 Tax=Candidatus Fischerbacteria bacterium RBG_13_37_8 TaxID=1817863 RepID=A0A1F5V8X7_9BACT|nr:MAG: 30S ribosomal protein S6 [Candidatus Fischerbacteria bacterium RBG_13_37_8]